MKTRWAVRFLLLMVGALTAAVVVLRTPWAGVQLCARGRGLLARVLDEPVRLARCEFDPLEARLEIDGIEIGGGEGRSALFSARAIRARLDPIGSLAGRLAIAELELDGPAVSLDVTPEPAEAPAPSAGCLRAVDRVRIGRLAVREAEVELRLPEQRRLEAGPIELQAQGRRGAYDVDVRVAAGALEEPSRRVPLQSLVARVRLDTVEERLEVAQLDVEAGGVALFAGGEIRQLCQPELGLRTMLRTELPALAALADASLAQPRGAISLTARLDGPAASPVVAGRLEVRGLAFDDLEPGDLAGDFEIADRKLELRELVWPVEEGRAIVRGTVLLSGELATSLEVRTEAMPFHRLLARLPIKNTPVLMTVDSRHQLTGKLLGGFELVGESELELSDFRVRSEPWHVAEASTILSVPARARLTTPIRITSEAVTLEGARFVIGPAPSTIIDVNARLGFGTENGGLSIRARASHLDLAHLENRIASLTLAGAGTVDAVIGGPYEYVTISGGFELEGARLLAADLSNLSARVEADPNRDFLSFSSVTGRRGETSYEGRVDVDLSGVDVALDGEVTIREGGRLSDVFGAFRDAPGPFDWLEENLGGRVRRAQARVRGPVTRLQAQGEAVASDVRFLDRAFDELALTLRLDDGARLVFEQSRLSRGGGALRGTGSLDLGAEGPAGVGVAVDLEAEGLPVRDLLGEFGDWAELQGAVGGRVRLGGGTEALEVSGELFAGGLGARGVPLSVARLTLQTRDGRVGVRGPVCGAGTLDAQVTLAASLPYAARFELDVSDLKRYQPEGARVGGSLAGRVDARGLLAEIGRSEGELELDALALLLGEYRLESQGGLRGTFAGRSLSISELRLQGENTALSLSGTHTAAGVLDAQAQGTFDARLIDTLVPQIENSTGVIDLKAAISGTAERPEIVGSADVRRGSFRVKALPIVVQKLQGTLAFSPNQVVVEDATFVANSGQARLRGTVALQRFTPTAIDLTTELERATWRLPEDWPAVVTGTVNVAGGWPDALVMSGALTLDRLRYTKSLDFERAMLDFSRRSRNPVTATTEELIRFDLELVGGPDMRIENEVLRSRLVFVAPPGAREGRLRVVGTNTHIGLLGSVELVDAIGFFRGNEYRVTQGVVLFNERDRIDPEFDVTAETEVRDYRVTVRGLGRFRDGPDGPAYSLQLDADPPLAQADIITLLTFGITSRDATAGAGAAAGAGVAAEALLAVSGLDEQVKRWLPQTQLLRDPDLSVTSQYSEATGQLEPMALFEAKVLSDRLKLKAATPFATSKGRRASAEYKVNERLSTQLLWENEETGYSAGDVGVDLKLRWEWE